MRDMLREANLAVNKAREASATALAPDELAANREKSLWFRYWYLYSIIYLMRIADIRRSIRRFAARSASHSGGNPQAIDP
jgi:hypothetical protein